MECNRDEALRARTIAERKFAEKDIEGAKKFALKAQHLFPSLEGITQMIATLDVHLASENKSNGEKDWYSILSVHGSADDDTVKRQYRKLALQLHPDKNKSIGAESAFQLISEAWSVLSDRSKRTLYDQKRNIKGPQQNTSQPRRQQSVPNTTNGFSNFTNHAAPKARAQKSAAPPRAAPSSAPVQSPSNPPGPNTFWTSCPRCKMQYEYLRIYVNHNLLCPKCHEPFLASEVPVPNVGLKQPVKSPGTLPNQNSNRNPTMKNAYDPKKFSSNLGMGSKVFQHGKGSGKNNFQWSSFSRTAGTASAAASSSAAAQASNMVQQAYEKVKREREQAQAASRRQEVLLRKKNVPKRNFDDIGVHNSRLDGNAPDREHHSTKKRRGITIDAGTGYGMEKAAGIFGDPFKSKMVSRHTNLSKDLSQKEIKSKLLEKAKASIREKVKEWKSAAAAKSAEKESAKLKQKQNRDAKEKLKVASAHDSLDNNSSTVKKAASTKNSMDGQNAGSDGEANEPMSIDVPDSDFHDFDNDRTERSFEADQIWATYDNEDGMPRYYGLVQKVISLKPFRIRMSFLQSKSNSEFGPLNWIASGFSKTCGDFRVGRYEVYDMINVFSHRVKWEKGPRGIINIIPRKGDIWALFRNWSPDWNEHTPDDVIYKYDMVEVLEDYSEEHGVSFAPLVKVSGFKTVFRRHDNPKEVKKILREEMFRFSHQVPSIVLNGDEAHNSPKGCYELDPAATPLELLQVIMEPKDADVIEVSKEPSVC